MDPKQPISRQAPVQAAARQRTSTSIPSGSGSTAGLVAGSKRTYDELHSALPQSSRSVRPAIFQQPSLETGETAPSLSASVIETVGYQGEPTISEYSQRMQLAATPSSTVDPALSLSFPRYDLPDSLVDNFAKLGIRAIYPWQKQCLLGPGLLDGKRNLVYTAPTGGGKSLVADILMLKRVLENVDAKALLVLPYVALVQEKVRWLRNLVQGMLRTSPGSNGQESQQKLWRRRADADTIRVVGFFGGGKIHSTWYDFDIGVCTFEKANALINSAISDCSITYLKAVVLDELHMVNDDHRGYLLELMATKMLSMEHPVQIIGMSATLSDMNLLATWLSAQTYATMYRPVPINEHLVYEGRTYAAGSDIALLKTISQLDSEGSSGTSDKPPLRIIKPSAHKEFADSVLNAVISLSAETVRAGYGVLVFCSSRQGCENDARLLSRVMIAIPPSDAAILERRLDLLGELRSLPSGLDSCLAETIPAGVAFHRMTSEERDLIAEAYDKGTLKAIVATCSLAAGINLPARRVILHNARMGRDLVGPSMLRQMRGRAGRKGKDEVGETYLCCKKEDLEDVVDLMSAELPPILSSLKSDGRRMQRALLEVVAVKLATGRGSIDDYVRKSLLALSTDEAAVKTLVDSSLNSLVTQGFIAGSDSADYDATQLGKAVVGSSLEPEDGAFIHRELQRALRAFVMDGEMHILYTFTPVQDFSITINWMVFRSEMESLDESGLRVLTLLGLKPTVIHHMARGGSLKDSTDEEKDTVRIYHRFYLALQLRDLCNEMPVHMVARKYAMSRGTVQTLAQTCQGFAAGIIKFCEQMGWGAMAAVLDHFADRLRAGARADLVALAQIAFVKSRTARVFYDNGFTTVAIVANANPQELVPVLMQAQPTRVRLKQTDEEKYEEKLLAKAKIICESANRLWQLEMQQDFHEE